MDYKEFIKKKTRGHNPCGLSKKPELHGTLFDFQKWIVNRSLDLGRSAIFADCGLGKSRMQIEWARDVEQDEKKPVLIIAPLIVCHQSVREGLAIDAEVIHVKNQDGVKDRGIYITNYDRAESFDASKFSGVVLDESSILKNRDGKTRTALIDQWRYSKYRLACTATPAPNDVMELGNHSEFLGVRTSSEMLSMYFVHDGGETQKWRIKRHAVNPFWRWVISWSTMLKKPCEIGFNSDGYELPPLNVKEIITDSVRSDGYLIALPASTLGERMEAYRNSMPQRVVAAKELATSNNEQWLIWCRLNEESQMLVNSIPGAVEITGSEDEEVKARKMLEFADGKIRVLVTKGKIAGFGANWQNCHNQIFSGVTDSYEQYYQCVRRSWRFGQKEAVNVYIIGSAAETAVFQNLRRKGNESDEMAEKLKQLTKEIL